MWARCSVEAHSTWDPIPRICDGEEVADCCEMAIGGEGCSAKGMVKANSGSSRFVFCS